MNHFSRRTNKLNNIDFKDRTPAIQSEIDTLNMCYAFLLKLGFIDILMTATKDIIPYSTLKTRFKKIETLVRKNPDYQLLLPNGLTTVENFIIDFNNIITPYHICIHYEQRGNRKFYTLIKY